MKYNLLGFMLMFSIASFAQVGIGTTTPEASAMLEVKSTTKGFLPPRVLLTATNAALPIASPSTGLLVYNTATAGTPPNDVTPGYYYWNGSAWIKLTENGTTKKAAFVGRGVDVTLGNLKVRLSASGNASLQVSTVSGTYTVSGSAIYSQSGVVSGSTIDGNSPLTITTNPAYLKPSWDFINSGATDVWIINDVSNTIAWRISLIIGIGYNNNMISIERIL
jgi:hypothetical protein